MEDYRFEYETLLNLCALADGKGKEEFQSVVEAVSNECKQRFGPTTFCPPPCSELPSPFLTAVCSSNLDVVKYVLETFPHAIDLNATGQERLFSKMKRASPALTMAAAITMKHLPMIQYLVEKGANVNQMSAFGMSPLMILASRVGIKESVGLEAMKYLIDSGADINQVDYKGETLVFGRHAQFACDASANIHHRNYEGHTALHVAAMSQNSLAHWQVKLLMECKFPLLCSPANSAPDYVPCPLYLAASCGNEELVTLLQGETGCPPQCVGEAYLLLGAAEFTNRLQIPNMDNMYRYLTLGLTFLRQHNCNVIYPPARPEYDYQVEFKTTDEVDAIWSSQYFLEAGMIFQCALIAERCLGPKSLQYANALLELGRKLIGSRCFTNGEKLWELCIVTMSSFDSHLCSQLEYCYGNMFLSSVVDRINNFTEGIQVMMRNSHMPKFLNYINYGLQSLSYLKLLCAKAIATGIYIEVTYHHVLERLLKLFLLWSTYDIMDASFTSLLHSFVGNYVYYPNKSTLLHVLLKNVLQAHHKQALYSYHHEEEFVVAVLNAGCGEVVNHPDKNGERPLHTVAKRKDIFKLLIDHGAHIDAVNSEGKTALPIGTFGVPSLYCTAANAIVSYSLLYQSFGLPSHVVQFIMLHDQSMHHL